MQNDKLLNYLHLHFIIFIWGFTAVLGALISIEAIPLVWYRMLMATGLILLFLKFRKISLKFPKRTLAGFALAGLIIALHWLAFFGAIKVANVSVTLAIMSTGAFFTSLLEPLFYKRKIIGYEVFFGLLVIMGLYIIFNVEGDYFLGIILALAASLLGALFSVINGKFAVKYNASAISFYELGFGTLCITVYLIFSGSFTSEFFQLKDSDWLYLFILASACTAYAFIASVHVMKWISPYTVMLTINMEPVYGIILALLVLGDTENMSPQFYYGALLIVLTVIANGIVKNRVDRKKRTLPNV
ncbi:DMT family transporter [Marinirhabdus gelatinilytica]|uniref:EamA-like transporter family protein n=1 Tax=Marinirhabdus gelatinilytica TaxID=1703343 RepID=A0A370Q912_9FLAO|nr:DMT family transporter [Marinirhabdus gelatinilytica]RDK84854.1 EamA-like transporter family protein [Marinirhabdus gelatinilytica]